MIVEIRVQVDRLQCKIDAIDYINTACALGDWIIRSIHSNQLGLHMNYCRNTSSKTGNTTIEIKADFKNVITLNVESMFYKTFKQQKNKG